MQTKTQKKQKHKKNKYFNSRRKRRKHKKQNGGFYLFNVKRAFTSGVEQQKPNQENTSYLCTETHNWITGATYFIEYITPNNFVLLKTPDTFITPKFKINGDETFVQIAEPSDPSRIKFIEYFINIRDHPDSINGWYCMMRIYGINTGYTANLTNILFYKLSYSWFNILLNSITISDSLFTIVDPATLNGLQQFSKINSGRIIKLNPGTYTTIASGSAFEILRSFRNGLIENANIKQEVIHNMFDLAVRFIF